MEQLDYAEILEKLDSLDAHLSEMGLGQFNRIRVHRSNISALSRASDEGQLDQLAQTLSPERRREIMWSFVESIEFVDAIEALSRARCDVPRVVLERALKGPPDLFNEDKDSTLGRNTMFEIAIAASAALAGAKPELGGEPDVLFKYEDRNVLIQCKRVLTTNGISKRIKEAATQLTRDLQKRLDPRDCAIIAISIARVINPGDKMLRAISEQAMEDMLRDEVEPIVLAHRQELAGIRHPKIVGALFYVGSPCYVENLELFTVAHSASVFHIPNKPDEGLLRKLARAMKV